MIENPRLALAVYIEDKHDAKGFMANVKINCSSNELGNILLANLETIFDNIKEPLRAKTLFKLMMKLPDLADKYLKQIDQKTTNKKNKRNKEN